LEEYRFLDSLTVARNDDIRCRITFNSKRTDDDDRVIGLGNMGRPMRDRFFEAGFSGPFSRTELRCHRGPIVVLGWTYEVREWMRLGAP
jgi:hypothetical protein